MIFHREITVESDKNNEDTSITVYLLYHYSGCLLYTSDAADE